MNKVVAFINEVRNELRKVSWPSREDLIGTAIIVCILVAIFAVILGGMDAVFSTLIKKLISY
ncbi:MAG: preprotein translocase subunit SecE [bacterium]